MAVRRLEKLGSHLCFTCIHSERLQMFYHGHIVRTAEKSDKNAALYEAIKILP